MHIKKTERDKEGGGETEREREGGGGDKQTQTQRKTVRKWWRR